MKLTVIPSFDTLPLELIYRILDNLDGQVIILSLRYVSKQMDIIVNTYLNQIGHKLNFDRMSKSDFGRVCRFVHPENVISLTLSDQGTTPGQISLFLSLFSIERFTRLRSLTLRNIEDQHLKFILKHAITCSLISLSVEEKDMSDRSRTTDSLLLTTIERPGLRNLTLTLMDTERDQTKWPTSSTIRHLTLYNCHLKSLPLISRHFSSLQTLSIKSLDLNDYESINHGAPLDLIPMRQLTSLIMDDITINMRKMESILSNTPSLTHLRLTGGIDEIDFRWEQLIQTKLPLLNKFEFFFYTVMHDNNSSTHSEILIAAFRTTFWLETKNWFVTCDQIKCGINHYGHLNYDIYLYSIPVRNQYFKYYSESFRMTTTTSTVMNNDTAVMDDVTEIMMATARIQKLENTPQYLDSMQITPPTHLFRKALVLNIRSDNAWSLDFVQLLSSLVDLSNLEKLTLSHEYPHDFYPNIAVSFVHLLKQGYNIHSLIITAAWLDETCTSNMNSFCSIIPRHIKHLEIDIQIMNDMKIILDRLEHLSSVTFRCLNGKQHWKRDIIEWLSERRYATYLDKFDTLYIWLGKKKSEIPRQMIGENKRFKRTY